MANIKTYLNNIKTAVFGSEVRDSIHDAIQQCYDDASAKDNANMEVKMARGTHNTLNDRLDNVDEIQAQTNAQLSELANKGTTVEVLERVTKEEINRQIADGTMANLTIADNSITTEKIKDGSITMDKLGSDIDLDMKFTTSNKDSNNFDGNVIAKGYYSCTDGSFITDARYSSTKFIKCYGANKMISSHVGNICFWDENKDFISGHDKSTPSDVVIIPQEARYLTHSIANNTINQFTLKFDVVTQIELGEQYIINGKSIKEKSLSYDAFESESAKAMEEFTYIKKSKNIFDKNNIIENKYYDIDGYLKPLSGYGSTSLIKCLPNTTYTKKDTGGKVTYWDENENFISGENNDTNYFTTPNDCHYVRVSFSMSKKDSIMIVQGKYENVSLMEYEDYQKGELSSELLVVNKSNLSDELKNLFQPKIDLPKIKLNPKEPLNIKTYSGGGNQPTHPSVKYFENGWNGYKYWMAYTPYPNNNNQEENPCIAYSNDGVNWREDGINNPISTAPSNGYNSDVHLVLVNNTLECWYREVVNNQEIIVRKTTTNGTDWSGREELYRTSVATGEDCVSPAVIYEDNKYKIWFVYKRQCLKYYESTDGKNWQFVRDIQINPVDSAYKVWHIDVIKTDVGYEFVGCYQYNGAFDKNNFIYYANSSDNIKYSSPVRILGNGYHGNFDSLELYRPCLTKINDGTEHAYYNLYYGAQGKMRNWAIGLVQASDIKSISGFVIQE